MYLTETERLKAIAICDEIQATIARANAHFEAAKKAADEFVRENADIIKQARP